MRRNIFVVLVGFLLAMAALMVMMTGVVVAGLSAQVVTAEGDVNVQRRGADSAHPLLTDAGTARVKVGDTILTGADGHVVLQWADGTVVEVDPDSRLEIRKYRFDDVSGEQESMLRLETGKVWARVAHELAGDSRFEIETPSAVAAVRGTIFSVAVTADGTVVEVLDGLVSLTQDPDQPGVDVPSQTVGVAGDGIRKDLFDDDITAAWEAHAIVLPPVRFARFRPATAHDGVTTLRGQAEPGASVSIDGQPVEVDAQGGFSHQVKVSSGENRYAVTVTDAAGHTRDLEHVIVYQP